MKFFIRNIIYLIVAVIIYFSINIHSQRGHWKQLIQFDGKGYYSYLPAIFIYHDLHWRFSKEIEKKYYPDGFGYCETFNGDTVNKFFCGTAVAMFPFFAAAHALTFATDEPSDGFSFWYAIMIVVSSIFYLFVALVFLKRLLLLYEITEKNVALILLVYVFGTNVFYYVISEPYLSHIYSFAFVTGFLFFTKKYFIGFELKNLFLASACLGIVIIIRPVNILIVASVPFLSGGFQTLKKGVILFTKNYFSFLFCGIILFSIISTQLVLYKFQTGKFFVYSYNEEGFNWFHPEIINFLFSYKKGLFVYVPILFFTMLFGSRKLFFEDRFQFFTFLFIFFLAVYVCSSWWLWYYGGSFGQRVFIEYYGLFAIIAGIALKEKIKYLHNIFITLCFFSILLCQVQTFQYRHGIIHWENMTKEKYWDVFLKLD